MISTTMMMMMMRGTVSSSSISSWTSVLFVVVVVLSSSSSSSSSSEENSFSLFSCPFLCVVFLPKNSPLPFSSLNNNRVCLDSKTQKSQKILNPPPVPSSNNKTNDTTKQTFPLKRLSCPPSSSPFGCCCSRSPSFWVFRDKQTFGGTDHQ